MKRLFFRAGVVCAIILTLSPNQAQASIVRRQVPNQPLPGALDGPYITNPPPGPDQDSTDWWYFSFIGSPVNGHVPTVELNFYRGFSFAIPSGGPRWRLDAQVLFPNGTGWELSQGITARPDGSDPTTVIQTGGEGVHGQWGDVGSFDVAEDGDSIHIKLTNLIGGLTGTINMVREEVAAHTACDANGRALPYYARLGNEADLTSFEQLYYRQAGWVMPMPRAKTSIDLIVAGSEFELHDAYGYHDKSWAPQAFSRFTNTWVFGTGSCGLYDISFYEVQAKDSPRQRNILTGFLARGVDKLQTQCSVYGNGLEGEPDSVTIKHTGSKNDSLGLNVPTGIVLDYVLSNGDVYHFTLQNTDYFPERAVYHRFRATGWGGLVGGEQFDCALTHEWLNPSRVVYREGESVFG